MDRDYKVKLEVFEGPLDLLLYLIKRDEVDIYDVSIERITKQYLAYLESFELLNIELAGEFIVMASNLLYIKSRMLLPVDQQMAEEDAEEDDPRWELIRQLIEYKKFKEAAARLREREALQEALFPRVPAIPELEPEGKLFKEEVGIFDLINAFQKILKRHEKKPEDLKQIFEENFTVGDKIEYLLRITSAGVPMRFEEMFTDAATRGEVVVTFLAMLELIRMKHLRVRQMDQFGEIWIDPIGADEASKPYFSPRSEESEETNEASDLDLAEETLGVGVTATAAILEQEFGQDLLEGSSEPLSQKPLESDLEAEFSVELNQEEQSRESHVAESESDVPETIGENSNGEPTRTKPFETADENVVSDQEEESLPPVGSAIDELGEGLKESGTLSKAPEPQETLESEQTEDENESSIAGPMQSDSTESGGESENFEPLQESVSSGEVEQSVPAEEKIIEVDLEQPGEVTSSWGGEEDMAGEESEGNDGDEQPLGA